MPELAEVEFYRRLWAPGLNQVITDVRLNMQNRVFRKTSPELISEHFLNRRIISSHAAGKKMFYRSDADGWLSLHLGMSGSLNFAQLPYEPAKHDHLVFYTDAGAMVFNDPRTFGLVLFETGAKPPEWWVEAEAEPFQQLSLKLLQELAEKHRRAPVKAFLLNQKHFAGIGNWMADEILWQAGIAPATATGDLPREQLTLLSKALKKVARVALTRVSENYGDLPRGWLFHQRWKPDGVCPKHKTPLENSVVGGRTSRWCKRCQHGT
jgi:formamidopyrimidine-DNA glycosylase